jgi:hypothetical protein
MTKTSPSTPSEEAPRWPIEQIEEALRGIRFGEVTIIVQDGVVIQVNRTERRRLKPPRSR